MTLADEVLSRINEKDLDGVIKSRAREIDGYFFQSLAQEAGRRISAGDSTGASSIAVAGINAADLIRSLAHLVTFTSILAQSLAPSDPVRARKILSDLREFSHQSGYRPGVVHAGEVIVFLCMQQKDLASATEYALSLRDGSRAIIEERLFEWRSGICGERRRLVRELA